MRRNALRLAQARVWLAAGLLCLLVGLPLATSAVAQVAGPTISVTGVDSKGFPTVSTNLTVTGSNGLPLVGLTAANFGVTEDGTAVASSSLVLDSDISQQLNLVLAVDVSVNSAGLAQIQSAADDFVSTLGPNDQVAILSFYDQVDVVQAFTSDKATLKTAIDNLTAGGNGTEFNMAADKAVNLLAALPPGRKAVVMFTNSGDTVNNLSPETTLANAQAATVRIYPMAFGTLVNPDLMRNWARFTGGQAYLLASATEIRPNLLTLGVLLRQSYKLSFKSGLSADNKTHAFTINFNNQGQSAQGKGSYTALAGQVQVVGPGIGQSVRGRVFLIVEVTAPAPVKSVTFQLDGQDLTKLTAPPFRYDWDSSTASPGIHTLTIKAVDQVGNQGQSQTTVNVVLVPPVVVVTATPARAQATAQAQAAQPNPIQAIQAKALPVVGRVAAGLALLAGALVAFFLWLGSLRSQRQVQEKICAVEVMNQGNVRSRYELRAEDPSGMLKFEFMLNDTDLAQRVGEPVEAKTAAIAAPARAADAPQEKQPNATVAKAKDAWTKANALENKAVATVNTGSVISNWIVTVSYLLPGTLGESLRGSTAGMRATQYEVRNVVDTPGRYQRMVAAAAPPRISTNPNMPLNTGNQLPTTWTKTPTSNGGNGATAVQTAVAQPKTVARSGWSLTPPVDAGDSLTVTLKVRPGRFPKSQHYAFKVLSRSVDGNEETPIIDHGSIALRGGPLFRRILSWVLLAVAVIFLALLTWYLLTTFGLIR